MASLTILPEANQSASQDLLQRLPSSNQLITESRKNRVIITKWLASRDALNYASVMLNLRRTGPLNPGGVLQELAQAKQIWEEKGTSTFYAFEAQLQWLELTYTLREPREVLSFLEKNKFLMPLLIEARFKIRSHFPNSRVFLEVDANPEDINDRQLVAFIATNLSPHEALRELKQFDEDWWLDALDRANGKLCINVEFE